MKKFAIKKSATTYDHLIALSSVSHFFLKMRKIEFPNI